MCFIQYAVQKNLILTIENEEKKKKTGFNISYELTVYFYIFFCGKTTNLPSFIPGKNLIFFLTENEENYVTRAQTGEISYTNITFSDQSLSPTVILLYLCPIQ